MPPLSDRRAAVIPPGWEAHHAPVAEGGMTAQCVVTRRPSTERGWDEAAGRSVYPPAEQVYAGPFRLQRGGASASRGTVAGGTVETERDYQVSLPLAAPELRVNDRVECVDAVDPQAVGLVLRIAELRGGSLVWQRDYMAVRWEETTR